MTTTSQKLTKEQRKEIALKEYEKIESPALKEYEKIKDTAYKEYEKIINSAWKEYEKIKNPAYKRYLKKIKEIDNKSVEVEKIKIIDGRKYKLVEEPAK